MVAVCIPGRLRTPALRSSMLNSFISRLLRRVHAADSYEHHAVPTVASAMSSAVAGSTQRFRCGSRTELAPTLHGSSLSSELGRGARSVSLGGVAFMGDN